MTTMGVVKLSELKQSKRLDAERYSPEFLALESELDGIPEFERLRSVALEPVRTGRTPPDRDFYDGDVEVCFIKTDTLREGLIDFEGSDLLPARSLSARDYLMHNDVVVTIIGAHFDVVGRASVFLDHCPRSTVNQNIAVIRPDENVVNPFFLMTFLNSRFGRKQLWMWSRQTEQVNLNCREVEKVLVPVFDRGFQKQVENIARESYELSEESKLLYSKSESMLLQELGLEDLSLEFDLTYSVSLSKAFGAHRIDAEYFQPAYDKLVRRIMTCANGHTRLLDCAERIKADFDPTRHPDRFFPYVELADIDTSVGAIRSASKVAGEEAPSRARRVLNENDVIVSSVEGSLEKVALIDAQNEGSLASTGFFQFRCRKVLPEVLLVLSKSIVLQAQFKKECSGTILAAVPNESLKRILIPIVDVDTQQEVASLVRRSHEVRRRARKLLEQAQREVEEAIEHRIKNR